MTAKRKTMMIAACAVALNGAAALAQELTGPELVEVDLNQTGIARYALRAPVTGDGTVRLSVPRDHADDVLASLVVRDETGGGVLSLTTATPAATPEALFGTPFEDGGLPNSLVAALNALVGEAVNVATNLTTVSGTLIGVAEREVVSDRQTVMTPTALVLGPEGGISEVVLTPGSAVSIQEDVADPLGQAAAAGHERETRQTFELTLSQGADRTVDLSYVTPAPIWKNSWRLLLDEEVLQGWATVENASASDWTDIQLTLSTGAPVAYDRDMMTPRRIPRSQPPELMAGRPDVRPDTGFVSAAASAMRSQLKGRPQQAELDGFAPSGNSTALAEVARVAPVRPAEVVQGVGAASFVLPTTVSIKAGETANLPYLDVSVSPEIRALYQPDRSRDVLLAVEIAAEGTLPPGLVSVQDASGFVGDAAFMGMDAGQTRYLTYAAAPNAEVVQDRTERATGLSITGSRNSLITEIRVVTRTVYDATVPEEVGIFAVEHPKSGDRVTSTSPDAEVEESGSYYRVTVPTEGGTAHVEIETERTISRARVADRNGLRALVTEISSGDIDITPEDGGVFNAAAEAVRAIQTGEADLEQLAADYRRLSEDQERVRRNLLSVQGDANLTRRYRDDLVRFSDEIMANRDEMQSVRATINAANERLDELVAGLIR